jgi:DNA transposition AAA+ family ATPase
MTIDNEDTVGKIGDSKVVSLDDRRPAERPALTPVDLRGQLQSVMSALKLSQKALAKELGCSQPSLNQWLTGKYKGDNEAIEAKVTAFLSRMPTPSVQDADPVASTLTQKRVHAALGYAQQSRAMVAVYGPPGIGKTHAIRQFVDKFPGYAWMATMHPGCKGLVSMLESVGQAVGVGDPGGGARRITEVIRSAISETQGVLIIDETQHLSLAAIEQLRYIHDTTEMGLALIGNESSYARLTGGTRAAPYAQIFSRLSMVVSLGRVAAADAQRVAQAWGVRDKETTDMIVKLSQLPGALRGICTMMRFIRQSGQAINTKTLREAMRLFGAEA